MPNNILKFKKYIALLDEVYKTSAKTAVLDINGALVRAGVNANEIVIPKIQMDGLADYDRNGGYVDGNVSIEHETVKFNYDRGRAFTVDAMDNEESAGIAFGSLSAEFIRTKVVPEMDAIRFAAYAGLENISKASGTLATGEEVIAALRAAATKMDEDEVPTENRILFITPTLRGVIADMDTTKSKEVLNKFSQVVEVPQSRFYTAIDLKDGKSSGEEIGGYVKNSDAKDINFMVIHKPAIIQFTKHVVNKIISPQENQTSDGWKYFYRAYGLNDAYENKVAGVYLHHKA